MQLEKSSKFFSAALLTAGLLGLIGCGGYGGSSSQPPPVPTSVSISPMTASVAAGSGTQGFTAMVGNDYLSRGVDWSLAGAGCSGAACGSLTSISSSSVTYNAPATAPNPATVTLTATSINDSSKSNSATITITSAMSQTTAISLTMTDTPPTGIALLSFHVSLTGATLNPGDVDLLGGKGPTEIEIKRLETESAFLSTANLAPGTFTTLALKFANPELTFKNNMGTTVAGCAAGSVCQIKPAGTLNSTINFSAPGLMVMANSPTGIQVDVNPNEILNNSLGVDFARAQAVSVQQLMTKAAGELDDLDDLRGAVQGLDAANKRFALHTLNGDFPIAVDGNTKFEFEECSASNFSCLQNDQIVEVDANLMAAGTFVAKKIEFEDDVEDDELEGVVFKIDDATHFEMVVLNELRTINNVNVGNPTVVTLSNPKLQVKADGLQVPSALRDSFEGATDTSQLIPGQTVQIRLTGQANPGPPLAVTTDRVRLRMTQFTGSVKPGSIVPPNFSVDMLPALFTGANIIDIQVQTSSDTDFEAISNGSALLEGETVSLRGMLFNTGSLSPELIARKVRGR